MDEKVALPAGRLARFSSGPGITPVARDGLALVLSSGLTSAVGLLYWVVAARLFAPATVGVNSVALSTMQLLGGIAHLNLTQALLRFGPVAGRHTRRLMLACYAVASTVAALVGLGYAAGTPWWAPEMVDAVGYVPLLVFFAVATPVWAIFTMQDYLLTALKRATVVPVENLVFALLKMGLLGAAVGTVVRVRDRRVLGGGDGPDRGGGERVAAAARDPAAGDRGAGRTRAPAGRSRGSCAATTRGRRSGRSR